MKVSLVSSYSMLYGEFKKLDLSKVQKQSGSAAPSSGQGANSSSSVASSAEDAPKQLSAQERKIVEKRKETIYRNLCGTDKPNARQLEQLKNFIATKTDQVELGKFLFGDTFTCNNQLTSEHIKKAFEKLNTKYKYFKSYDEVQGAFEKAYKACSYFNILERSQEAEIGSRAYKMCVLCLESNKDILSSVETLIKKSSRGYTNPVHDTFYKEIPRYFNFKGVGSFNLNKWRHAIKTLGDSVLDYLIDAEQIERLNNKAVPESLTEFADVAAKLIYERYDEDPNLGKLFNVNSISERMFDRSLDLYQSGRIKNPEMVKLVDTLPDVALSVAGGQINQKLKAVEKELSDILKAEQEKAEELLKQKEPEVVAERVKSKHELELEKSRDDLKKLQSEASGKYLVKIPKADPRVLVLGALTGCCQSVTDDSEKCVIDAMTLPNNNCYVLVKRKGGEVVVPTSTAQNADLAESSAQSASPRVQVAFDWKRFEKDGHKIAGVTYAWRSLLGNFTCDSLEISEGVLSDEVKKIMVDEFAAEIMAQDPSIHRVTLGTGGRTPQNLWPLSKYSESMNEGYMYGDALRQYEIRISDELKGLREQLRLRSGVEDQTSIATPAQARFLLGLDDVTFKKVKSDYSNLSLPYFMNDLQGIIAIKESNEELYRKLTSNEIIGVYVKKHVDWKVLKDMDFKPDSIASLFSKDAFKCYEAGYLDWRVLANYDDKVVQILISTYAFEAYKSGLVNWRDLHDLSAEAISHIVSISAQSLYKQGIMSAKEFGSCTPNQMEAMLQFNAAIALGKKYVTFEDLKSLSAEEIAFFTNHEVQYCYQTGMFTFQDIKDLEIQRIKEITSADAILLFSTGRMKWQDLIDIELDKLPYIINTNAYILVTRGYANLDELKNLDTEKLKFLMSEDVTALRDGYARVGELQNLDIKKIEVLTSKDAFQFYQMHNFKCVDLKNYDVDKIALLISPQALEAYNNQYVKFDELKALDSEGIKRALSPELNRFAESYNSFARNSFGASKLSTISNIDVLNLFSKEEIKSDVLKKLDTKEIINLVNERIKNSGRGMN